MKKWIALLLAIAALLSLTACGGGSDLPSLSGYYECESYAFDISALEFESDGTATLYMDWNYTGTYKAKGDGYVLEITGGQSSVAGTQWGNKKYMNMKHLEAALEDVSIAG